MTNHEINFIDSVLEVKASGTDNALEDLELPTGKSIAELIDDQEKIKE